MTGPLSRLYSFYRDGFRSMTVGRDLWKIIALKLLIMFAVLKLFFFPNYLNTKFDNDADRSTHVLGEITAAPAPLASQSE